MASKVLSVSVPDYIISFLDENPDLKPSKILQAKILEIMENSRDATERIKQIEKEKQRIIEHRDRVISFIDKKGLLDEFLKGGGY